MNLNVLEIGSYDGLTKAAKARALLTAKVRD